MDKNDVIQTVAGDLFLAHKNSIIDFFKIRTPTDAFSALEIVTDPNKFKGKVPGFNRNFIQHSDMVDARDQCCCEMHAFGLIRYKVEQQTKLPAVVMTGIVVVPHERAKELGEPAWPDDYTGPWRFQTPLAHVAIFTSIATDPAVREVEYAVVKDALGNVILEPIQMGNGDPEDHEAHWNDDNNPAIVRLKVMEEVGPDPEAVKTVMIERFKALKKRMAEREAAGSA